MNSHGEKERLTSVPILCRITLQNVPYMDYKLLVLMSFEVTTVTSMGSRSRCEHAAYHYKARFQPNSGREIRQRMGQTMYGSLTLLCAASWHS